MYIYNIYCHQTLHLFYSYRIILPVFTTFDNYTLLAKGTNFPKINSTVFFYKIKTLKHQYFIWALKLLSSVIYDNMMSVRV